MQILVRVHVMCRALVVWTTQCNTTLVVLIMVVVVVRVLVVVIIVGVVVAVRRSVRK